MNTSSIRLALSFKDMEARSACSAAVLGLPWIELADAAAAQPVDLIIHEVPGDRLEGLEEARGFLSDSQSELFLAASAPTPDTLIQAMRSGVQEFLSLPLDAEELRSALERFRRRHVSTRTERGGNKGRIIAVAGTKGGIGTTTLAVNLASELHASLARSGAGEAALLDLRIPQGEIPLFLDLEFLYTWEDVVNNIGRLDQTYLASVMAHHSSGLAVLPAPDMGHAAQDGGLNAQVVQDILLEMADAYSHVFVDMRTGLDDVSLRVLNLADEVYAPMVLSLPCLARTKRFLERLRTLDPEAESKIQLVVTRHFSGSQIDAAEAEQILEHKVSRFIPDDYQVTLEALNQGKTLAECAPKSAVRKAVADMASSMAPEGANLGAEKGKGSLFGLFSRSNKAGKAKAPQARKADAAERPGEARTKDPSKSPILDPNFILEG